MITIDQLQNRIICADCLDVLRQLPDKCVDLLLTDPPYGINYEGVNRKSGDKHGRKAFGGDKVWDLNIPQPEFFKQMIRVSKNQIIWGGNYFIESLKNTRCFLIWDKVQNFSGSDFEMAWTSFDKCSKIFRQSRVEAYRNGTIHPTQKPLKLFEWCLSNYSNENDLVLDCFSGSGTTAVACHNLKRRFICIERDKEYYRASCERLEQAQRQQTLF